LTGSIYLFEDSIWGSTLQVKYLLGTVLVKPNTLNK